MLAAEGDVVATMPEALKTALNIYVSRQLTATIKRKADKTQTDNTMRGVIRIERLRSRQP